MNATNPKLELGEFAIWLISRRARAGASLVRLPSAALLDTARQVWEQQQWERTEARRFFRPLRLAAADGDNAQAPLEMKIRIRHPHQDATLTFEGFMEFMRVGQGEQWRVLCRVDAAQIQALLGYRLRVHIGGETLNLGPFNSRGIARADLPTGLQPGDLLGLELVVDEKE
jgi:hypothetical protein